MGEDETERTGGSSAGGAADGAEPMQRATMSVTAETKDRLAAWKKQMGEVLMGHVSHNHAIVLLMNMIGDAIDNGYQPDTSKIRKWWQEMPRPGRKRTVWEPQMLLETWLGHVEWCNAQLTKSGKTVEPKTPEEMFTKEQVKALRDHVNATDGAGVPQELIRDITGNRKFSFNRLVRPGKGLGPTAWYPDDEESPSYSPPPRRSRPSSGGNPLRGNDPD